MRLTFQSACLTTVAATLPQGNKRSPLLAYVNKGRVDIQYVLVNYNLVNGETRSITQLVVQALGPYLCTDFTCFMPSIKRPGRKGQMIAESLFLRQQTNVAQKTNLVDFLRQSSFNTTPLLYARCQPVAFQGKDPRSFVEFDRMPGWLESQTALCQVSDLYYNLGAEHPFKKARAQVSPSSQLRKTKYNKANTIQGSAP